MNEEQPILGIDVHPEYQRGLNFERARTEGYEFCVIRATEDPYRDGDRYVPSGFEEFYRRAEAEGFVMGAYAFLLGTPAKAQADHFLRTIEAVGGPEDNSARSGKWSEMRQESCVLVSPRASSAATARGGHCRP